MNKKIFHHIVPFLPVRNLQETINFYRDMLGFYDEWFWETTDAGIQRDHLQLIFCLDPEFVSAINTSERHLEFAFEVEHVDDIYKEYQERNVQIVSKIEVKPWGFRSFTLQDVNGYYIRIGEPLGEEEPVCD